MCYQKYGTASRQGMIKQAVPELFILEKETTEGQVDLSLHIHQWKRE